MIETFEWKQEEREVSSLETRIEASRELFTRATIELKTAEALVVHSREAQEILQLLAESVQRKAHKKLADVVTSCLSSVFDDPYEFHIVFERKRGKTDAVLRFRKGGLDVDPLTASGGGMIDVAAFALRIACLVLHRPRLSKVVVLDEPFRFVSAQYQENVRSMLEELSTKMGLQIIMVTHIEALSTGEVIEI